MTTVWDISGSVYSVRSAAAIHFAVDQHAGQLRKGTDTPYIVHPDIAFTCISTEHVWVHGGTQDGRLFIVSEVHGDGDDGHDSEAHWEYSKASTEELFACITPQEFASACEGDEGAMWRILRECGIEPESHCVI